MWRRSTYKWKIVIAAGAISRATALHHAPVRQLRDQSNSILILERDELGNRTITASQETVDPISKRLGGTHNCRLSIRVNVDKLFCCSYSLEYRMTTFHHPEFECDRCNRIIVVSPRLLTAETIIRCPQCQNIFGTWGNSLPRFATEKDNKGVLHLAKPKLAHGSKVR